MLDTSNFRRDPAGGTALSSPFIFIFVFTKGGLIVVLTGYRLEVSLLLLLDYFHAFFLDRKVLLSWCTDFMSFTITTTI